MKKNNYQGEDVLPTTVSASGRSPETDVLAEFNRLREILAATHTEIPQLLARQRGLDRALGLNDSAELRAQLQDVVRQREAAVRRRASAIAAIADMEPALQSERARVEQEQREHAVEAVRAFQARYGAAVATLQGLWSEADMLSRALRCPVPAPLPVTVVTSPVDGVARAVPVQANSVAATEFVTVDAEAARLGALLDQLGTALGLCNAIRQGADLEARHHRLSMNRGSGSEHSGVFKVMLTFRSWDGLEFQPGDLVDHTLVGSGMLHRLQTGRRYIEPLRLEAA